jgi:hypothetical protein
MMTVRIFILLLIAMLLGCTVGSAEKFSPGNGHQSENPAPTPTVQHEDPTEPPISSEEREALETPTKAFRIPSPEFENVDFRNHAYPYTDDGTDQILVKLRDGHFEDEQTRDGWFDFEDVFYTDLTGDGKKEAIVFLYHVACGGSCDGGAFNLFVFDPTGNLDKPSVIELGSTGYGCAARTIKLVRDKIVMDLFGDCALEDGYLKPTDESQGMSKFRIKDTTHLVLAYHGGFAQESRYVTKVPERSVLNFQYLVGVEQ